MLCIKIEPSWLPKCEMLREKDQHISYFMNAKPQMSYLHFLLTEMCKKEKNNHPLCRIQPSVALLHLDSPVIAALSLLYLATNFGALVKIKVVTFYYVCNGRKWLALLCVKLTTIQ